MSSQEHGLSKRVQRICRLSTRRQFLFAGCAVPLVALTAPARVLAETILLPARRPAAAADLGFESFARQLNTTFRIRADSGRSILVRLDEARLQPEQPVPPGRRPPGDAGSEKFSLIFTGRRGELLEQNTYRFEHEALGQFEFFIVPVFTRNPAKIDYEAVVNRPRSNF
jgi:hypothetical protein